MNDELGGSLRVVGTKFYSFDIARPYWDPGCLFSGVKGEVGVDVSPTMRRIVDWPEDRIIEVNCSGKTTKTFNTVHFFLKLIRCRLS